MGNKLFACLMFSAEQEPEWRPQSRPIFFSTSMSLCNSKALSKLKTYSDLHNQIKFHGHSQLPWTQKFKGLFHNLLITGDAAVNSSALISIDNDEGKPYSRVLGRSTKRGDPLPVTLHQVLVRENLRHSCTNSTYTLLHTHTHSTWTINSSTLLLLETILCSAWASSSCLDAGAKREVCYIRACLEQEPEHTTYTSTDTSISIRCTCPESAKPQPGKHAHTVWISPLHDGWVPLKVW